MNIDVEVIQKIPEKQINEFESKVTYNIAVYTREFTKSEHAFPYLTGKLQANEVAAPITGNGLEYGLLSGVGYAVKLYKKNKAEWTNPTTQPHWYHSVFEKNHATIINQAVSSALKEIK